jgi:hypothetical protein
MVVCLCSSAPQIGSLELFDFFKLGAESLSGPVELASDRVRGLLCEFGYFFVAEFFIRYKQK